MSLSGNHIRYHQAPSQNSAVHGDLVAESLELTDLTASRVVVTDGSKVLASSDVTATELEVLNGVTPGFTTASKALVVNASKELDELGLTTLKGPSALDLDVNVDSGQGISLQVNSIEEVRIDGTTTLFNNTPRVSGGTASTVLTLDGSKDVTSSSVTTTELDVLGGVTAGTATASKALVLDASKDLGDLGTLGVEILNGTSGANLRLNAKSGQDVLIQNNNTTKIQVDASLTTFTDTVRYDTGTASTVLTLDANKDLTSSSVTTGELEYLDVAAIGTAEVGKALILSGLGLITGITKLGTDTLTSGTSTNLALQRDGTAVALFGTDTLALGDATTAIPQYILPYRDYRDCFISLRDQDWTFYGWSSFGSDEIVIKDSWSATWSHIQANAGVNNSGTAALTALVASSGSVPTFAVKFDWPKRTLNSVDESMYFMGGSGATYTTPTLNNTAADGGEGYAFTWPYQTALVRIHIEFDTHTMVFVDGVMKYQNGWSDSTREAEVEVVIPNGAEVVLIWSEELSGTGSDSGQFTLGNGFLGEGTDATRYVYGPDGTEIESVAHA